jgi:hypothetical protein
MFHRMFLKFKVHSENLLVPKGCGLKLLYRGMIPVWFWRAMFLFLFIYCHVSWVWYFYSFENYVSSCFLHVPYMFVIGFCLDFFHVFPCFFHVSSCFCHVYHRFLFQLCIRMFYNSFFHVSMFRMFCNLWDMFIIKFYHVLEVLKHVYSILFHIPKVCSKWLFEST